MPRRSSVSLRLYCISDEALAELGLDPTDTYRRAYAGLPLTQPLLEAREEHDNAPRFWQALQGISGDADIGLHLGEAMRPRPMDVVGYLLLARVRYWLELNLGRAPCSLEACAAALDSTAAPCSGP